MIKDTKQNIRYLGFEASADGGRRFDFSLTGVGQGSTRVSMDIPGLMFSGANRISYQESAKICYEKLRFLLEQQEILEPLRVRLTVEDIERFRHVPRGSKSRTQATST
jgi:hypothetical protein